jgi:hypothetical protein
MKRRFILPVAAAIVALAMALGLSAFTSNSKDELTNYYWYLRTATNTYVSDGFGPNPSSGCSNGPVICAKGFLSTQVPSQILDATPAADERKKPN